MNIWICTSTKRQLVSGGNKSRHLYLHSFHFNGIFYPHATLYAQWLYVRNKCVKNMLFSFPNSLSREKLDFSALCCALHDKPRHWSVGVPKIFPLHAIELCAYWRGVRWCVWFSLFAQFRYLPSFSQKIASKRKVCAANTPCCCCCYFFFLFFMPNSFLQNCKHDMYGHV